MEFYLSTRDGNVVFGEENTENCVVLAQEQETLLRIFISENASELITITQSLYLSIHEIIEGL